MIEFSDQLLFHIGIGIMICAVVSAIISVILFSIFGRRLKARLEQEFGRKRH